MTASSATAPAVADKPSSELRWTALIRPVYLVALGWALFQIAIFIWPTIDLMVRRCGHISFAVALALLVLRDRASSTPLRWGYLLAALAALTPPLYLAAELDRIYDRITELDPVLPGDIGFASLLLVLLLIVTWRYVGLGMALLGGGFIAYQLFGGAIPGVLGHNVAGFDLFIDILFLTERGLFGVPTAVSAEIVFYFILFAAIFDVYGGGRLIIDLALRLTGQQTGGPAKAAVVASALSGSVSGSAVANVMSTGIFTIPLMRRTGYPPTFAAAGEAIASTGGQITPPVMGAGAFIMADFLHIAYTTIVFAALIPALLYFTGLFIAVHIKARLDGITALDSSEQVSLGGELRRKGHLLLPLAVLVGLIVSGFAIVDAAIYASVLAVVLGNLFSATRQPLLILIEALIKTSQRALSVAIPCAIASIIVSVISFTGLGTKFTSFIVHLASGTLWLAVGLAALGSLILGAGMPTTSAYIMAAVLIAPALVQLGTEPLVAHLFVFYLAIISMITPPVALAAYAASTIAETPANRTGWMAFRIALPLVLIPFTFILQPALITWVSAGALAWALVQALVMIWAFTIAIIGWLDRPLSIAERLLFTLIGVGCVWPITWLSIVAIVIGAAVALIGYRRLI